MDWCNLAPGRKMWWAFVNTAMNFKVLLIAGNFLDQLKNSQLLKEDSAPWSKETPCTIHCKMLRKLAITCRVSIPLRGSTAEAGTFCNFRCCIKISATAWELCEAK